MNPVIRIIRTALHLSPHLNLFIAERIIGILLALRAASVEVRPETKARITRLADTEAVGVR